MIYIPCFFGSQWLLIQKFYKCVIYSDIEHRVDPLYSLCVDLGNGIFKEIGPHRWNIYLHTIFSINSIPFNDYFLQKTLKKLDKYQKFMISSTVKIFLSYFMSFNMIFVNESKFWYLVILKVYIQDFNIYLNKSKWFTLLTFYFFFLLFDMWFKNIHTFFLVDVGTSFCNRNCFSSFSFSHFLNVFLYGKHWWHASKKEK